MKIEISDACTAWGWVCWLDAHPGLAAWAQTVGVVLTLAGALLAAQIPLWGARLEKKRARKEALVAASGAAAMVGGFIAAQVGGLQKVMAGSEKIYAPQAAFTGLEHCKANFKELTAPAKLDAQVIHAIATVHFYLNCAEAVLQDAPEKVTKSRASSLLDKLQFFETQLQPSIDFLERAAEGSKEQFVFQIDEGTDEQNSG